MKNLPAFVSMSISKQLFNWNWHYRFRAAERAVSNKLVIFRVKILKFRKYLRESFIVNLVKHTGRLACVGSFQPPA